MDQIPTAVILNNLIDSMLTHGHSLILPLFSSLCMFVTHIKIKSIGKSSPHPCFPYLSLGFLFYFLYFIVPLLIKMIILANGDSLDNQTEITVDAFAFAMALPGTIMFAKGALCIKEANM